VIVFHFNFFFFVDVDGGRDGMIEEIRRRSGGDQEEIRRRSGGDQDSFCGESSSDFRLSDRVIKQMIK
jgi:hypothetical protein